MGEANVGDSGFLILRRNVSSQDEPGTMLGTLDAMAGQRDERKHYHVAFRSPQQLRVAGDV